MSIDIKSTYQKLAAKYTLPTFAVVDAEYEISTFEEGHFLLRNIARRMAEKLVFYNQLINDVLQPDTSSLFSMHEAHFFSDIEKNKLYELYKRLMKINRSLILASLESSDKAMADAITLANAEWSIIKEELKAPIAKMKESWGQEAIRDEELGYLG